MGYDLDQRLDGEKTATKTPPTDGSTVGKQTRLPGAGDARQVRTKILALRAERAAASPDGIRLLTWLVPSPDAVFAVEGFLQTGQIVSDRARALSWLPAIEALADDARAAYDAAIKTRGGAGLAAVIASARAQPNPATTEPTPRDVVRTERAAGRGDSAAAVAALRSLFELADDPVELARVECTIATGALEFPLRLRHWAERLRALPADAARGYDAALRAAGGTIAYAILLRKLGAIDDRSGQIADAIAVINAYRAAGKDADAPAVERLAFLLRLHNREVAAVEAALLGRRSTEGISAQVPPQFAIAYQRARDLLDGKSRRERDGDQRRRRDAPIGTEQPQLPAPLGVGGGSDGALSPYFRFGPTVFGAGVPDGDKNAFLAMQLLLAYNPAIPPELALWIATCDGVPPDRAAQDRELVKDIEATGQLGGTGTRTALTRTKARTGGYHGYQIIGDDGQTLSTEAIDTALGSDGYIDLRLNLGFYKSELEPLIAGYQGEGQYRFRAELQARDLQREIEELERQDQDVYVRTGQHDRGLMNRIVALKSQRNRLQRYAADLASGATSVTAEMGKFQREIDRLTKLAADAAGVANATRVELVKDLEQQRRERPNPKATWVTPMRDYAEPDAELSRKVTEADAYAADLREQIKSLESMMGTGAQFPTAALAQAQKTRERIYRTADGSYAFTSNLQATGLAIDGALAGVSSKLWTGIGGIAWLSGAGLAFVSGEPWFSQLGDDLSRRAWSVAGDIQGYASTRTAEAERVLGKTATMVIQLVTSTAVYICILGPVAIAGGAVGAAIAGEGIASTFGSMATMAAAGGLMDSDKDGLEIAKSAGIMSLMPLFAGAGRSLRGIISAFLGFAALDAASQFDLRSALSQYQMTGNYQLALQAGGASIDFKRMFASGMLGALLAAASKPAAGARTLAVGEKVFALEGGKWQEVAKPTRAQRAEAVKVNSEELASIRGAQDIGNTKLADDLIGRAQTRGAAISETSGKLAELDRSIGRLERLGTLTGAQAEQLATLRGSRARYDAQLRVLRKVQAGERIPVALARDAGIQPAGYLLVGDAYLPMPGKAAQQSAAYLAQIEQALPIAKQLGEANERLDRLTKQIKAEEKAAKPDEAKLASLREQITKAGDEAAQLRAKLAAIMPEPTTGTQTPTTGTQTQTTDTQTQTKPTNSGDLYEVPALAGSGRQSGSYGPRAAALVDQVLAAIERGVLRGDLASVLDALAKGRRAIADAMNDPSAAEFGTPRGPRDNAMTPFENRDGETVYGPWKGRVLATTATLSTGEDIALTANIGGKLMIHTEPQQIAKIMAEVEPLYERALSPTTPAGETMNLVGQIHWWLAHAMPYRRGSAAIVDMLAKSILLRRGIQPRAWKPEVAADLEAFSTPTAVEFGDKYAALMVESTPTPAQTVPVYRLATPGNTIATATLDPRLLLPTQAEVMRSKIETKKAAIEQAVAVPGAIKVIESNGKFYIYDGHHTVKAAVDAGLTEVPVKVYTREQAERLGFDLSKLGKFDTLKVVDSFTPEP